MFFAVALATLFGLVMWEHVVPSFGPVKAIDSCIEAVIKPCCRAVGYYSGAIGFVFDYAYVHAKGMLASGFRVLFAVAKLCAAPFVHLSDGYYDVINRFRWLGSVLLTWILQTFIGFLVFFKAVEFYAAEKLNALSSLELVTAFALFVVGRLLLMWINQCRFEYTVKHNHEEDDEEEDEEEDDEEDDDHDEDDHDDDERDDQKIRAAPRKSTRIALDQNRGRRNAAENALNGRY